MAQQKTARQRDLRAGMTVYRALGNSFETVRIESAPMSCKALLRKFGHKLSKYPRERLEAAAKMEQRREVAKADAVLVLARYDFEDRYSFRYAGDLTHDYSRNRANNPKSFPHSVRTFFSKRRATKATSIYQQTARQNEWDRYDD